MKRLTQGFTLVELMIVIAIIGVLCAIAFPWFRDNTQRSQNSACLAEAKGYMATAVADLAAGRPANPPQPVSCEAGTVAPTAANYQNNDRVIFTLRLTGNPAVLKESNCWSGNARCELAP